MPFFKKQKTKKLDKTKPCTQTFGTPFSFVFFVCFFSCCDIGGIKHLDKLALKLEYKQTVEPILQSSLTSCVSLSSCFSSRRLLAATRANCDFRPLCLDVLLPLSESQYLERGRCCSFATFSKVQAKCCCN